MKKPKNIVVIVSGGMDSAVLLKHLLHQKHHLRALSVNYGQRHDIELTFAESFCRNLEVPWEVADLSALKKLLPGSSQTDDRVSVPDGHYSEETMKVTVVPNRNMIMLSVAIGHAIAHQYDFVAYGAHSGDHAIYPDCREKFVKALNKAAGLCDWRKIKILRPFIKNTKSQIAALGINLGIDFRQTWSCYKGGEFHCGTCGTCIERREAFYLAGVQDPTIYEDGAPSVGELAEANWKISKATV